jgi:hypothetical protein
MPTCSHEQHYIIKVVEMLDAALTGLESLRSVYADNKGMGTHCKVIVITANVAALSGFANARP